MAKRFITTTIFEDAWYMDLPAKYKLFWLFLITNCDHAGIWQVNYKLASFYVGEHLEPGECERIMRDRIVKLDDGKYWFIPKFIVFQYGLVLKTSNKALEKVISSIDKYNLTSFLPKVIIERIQKQGAAKGLDSPLQGVKEKEEDKDKEEVELKEEEKNKIQTLWIRTFGRNPKIPEMEETQRLLNKYGLEKLYETFKKAALRKINSLQYLLDNVDANFSLIPYNKIKAEGEISPSAHNYL